MIEVQIPKDVSGYESPLIGPLTARQTACIAAAAVTEYVYYMVVTKLFPGMDLNSIVGMGVLVAIPFLYLAVGKPYDMRPEVYIYYFLLPSLLAKKDRPYETELTYDTILRLIEGDPDPKEVSKKKSKTKTKTKGRQDTMYA